jgi:hypothetical protein
MPSLQPRPGVLWLSVVLLSPEPVLADEDDKFGAAARLRVGLASGVPANDMPGYGIYGTYRLNDDWSIGLSFDQMEFDYEEPARRLGLPIDSDAEPVDAKVDQQIVAVSVLRSLSPPQASREWFVGAELGMAFTDVPVITGPTSGGGSFEIHTEVDRELIASLLGGVRQRFADRWFVELTLRADQHFAAWEPVDVVSGTQGRHDDYFAYGAHLGLGYRF